jgi:hypothetical protein
MKNEECKIKNQKLAIKKSHNHEQNRIQCLGLVGKYVG